MGGITRNLRNKSEVEWTVLSHDGTKAGTEKERDIHLGHLEAMERRRNGLVSGRVQRGVWLNTIVGGYSGTAPRTGPSTLSVPGAI